TARFQPEIQGEVCNLVFTTVLPARFEKDREVLITEMEDEDRPKKESCRRPLVARRSPPDRVDVRPVAIGLPRELAGRRTQRQGCMRGMENASKRGRRPGPVACRIPARPGFLGTLDKVVSIIYSGRTYLRDKYLRALTLSRQRTLRSSRRSF